MRKISRASAAGKVNLYFGVGSLLPDGYHEVASIYQSLSLRETVSVALSDSKPIIEVDGEISELQLGLVPRGESNLVVKAGDFVCELARTEQVAIDYDIFKRVPVAGGMAGGSADAAAALVAVNDLLGVGLSQERLIAESVKLGADVPFALMGGTAIGVGRGEKLEPLHLGAQLHFVMIFNQTGLRTPDVYAQLDKQRENAGTDPRTVAPLEKPAAIIDALAAGSIEAVAKWIHNDLESAAISLLPELELTIAAAERYGAARAFVSGSGPTVAALVETHDAAVALATALRHANFDAIVTSSSSLGALLEQADGE